MGYPCGNTHKTFRLTRKEVKLAIEIWKYFCLENPADREEPVGLQSVGSQSPTRLKRLSTHALYGKREGLSQTIQNFLAWETGRWEVF